MGVGGEGLRAPPPQCLPEPWVPPAAAWPPFTRVVTVTGIRDRAQPRLRRGRGGAREV